MPFISQIGQQSDYNLFGSATPLVIDNGASYFRNGWAGKIKPRVCYFPPIFAFPKVPFSGLLLDLVI
ncbi:Nuclear actin-protein involved in chromatin remodeling [Stylosanthes scabra]|uniref:Nuclear actin-protein involved in chromatin remodeling n=1 Tax=Stylosanthes scabra TaxID=79078 RepID=A0ABU6S9F5_9FABA|nr:Nuclear actin-protein involved in chromatin remodeling [Stylosanthes scabra]